MSQPILRAPLVFAGAGHGLFHILTALLPTIVLVLGPLWNQPYEDLIALWTIGALLLGLGAPLAGWLADQWGEVPMMILYFVGIGASAVLCGLAAGPLPLEIALAGLGLFGAIYHPVGTAWVVQTSVRRGQAIALVGVCGGLGVAAASLVAGGLTDLWGWRMAFIVPGAITIGFGCLLGIAWWQGAVVNRSPDVVPEVAVDAAAQRQTIMILVVTMCLTSVMWYAFMTMLPKWLGGELGIATGHGLSQLGLIVSLVYLAGTAAQFVGGYFADRGSAKQVYAASFALKLCAFLLAQSVTGWPIVIVAMLIVVVFDIAAPVENVLIAQYASARRRGLAYGLRHGIAIVSAPLGVQLVSWLYDDAAGFRSLLLVLAMTTLVVFLAALMLPANPRTDAAAAPAQGRAARGT